MNDMSTVIIPKSDQINADDLIAGPRTIRITDVRISPGTEQPVSIFYDGDDGKPWRPCKSMSRVLVAVWGADAKAYVGRSVTLYRDPNVKWGGLAVGGIRISHMSHLDAPKTMALTETRANRKPFTVKPLANAPAPKNGDQAAKWTADFLAILATKTEPGAAQAFADSKAAKLAELRDKRPELAAEIDMALSDILASPVPAAGSLPAEDMAPQEGEAAAPSEGRGDEDHGETPSLEDACRAIDAAELVRDVNTLVTSYEGQLSTEDHDALKSHGLARVGILKGGK